jgi:Bacterial Ig domain/PQQ-like domain
MRRFATGIDGEATGVRVGETGDRSAEITEWDFAIRARVLDIDARFEAMSSRSRPVKNLLPLIAAFILSIQLVAAQSVTQSWVQRYNAPANDDDFGQIVRRDAAGDVFVAGDVTRLGGGPDQYVVKYSGENGERLWERQYQGTGGNADYSDFMEVDSAGNVIVCGPSIGANGAGYDYYTVKYNGATGAVIWEKRFHGNNNFDDIPYGMALDPSGNVIVTGISEFFGGVDYYTVKYSGVNGAVLWGARSNGEARLVRVTTDSNGDVYVASGGLNLPGGELTTQKFAGTNGALIWQNSFGTAFSGIAGIACDPSGNPTILVRSSNSSSLNFYTIKYRSDNGTRMWERRATYYGWPNALGVDPSGNVFVTGWISLDSPDLTKAFYTAKYGADDGALLWEKIYNPPSSDDQAQALAVDPEGNVIVSGFSNKSAGHDFTTLKYAGADGAVLWEQIYNGPDNGDDVPYSVVADGLGGAVVTGYSVNAARNADILTIKYAPPPGPPAIVTLPASNITFTSATLNGRVSSNGRTTSLFFERSDRPGEAQWITATPASASFGASDLAFSATLSDLQPHTSYSFRAIGRNSLGTSLGPLLSFTTSNTLPTATPASIHSPGTDFTFDLRAKVSDGDGDPVTIVSVTGASFGTVSPDGTTIHYVGGPAFNGNDTFTYTISDGFGGNASAIVTLTNAAPIANPDSLALTADGAPLMVTLNDTDADGDSLSLARVEGASFGTASIVGTNIIYSPNPSFEGIDQFTYIITDGRGATSSAVVSIKADHPVFRVLAMEGEPVGGIQGAVWKKLGIPSIFQNGTRAGWGGTISNRDLLQEVIVSGELGAPVVQLRSTDPVPDRNGRPIRGMQFAEFSDPVFAGDDFGFVAKVSGTPQKDDAHTGIWVRTNGVMRAVLREGQPAPGTAGTAKFDSFTSLAMPRVGTLFVVAKLRPFLDWAPRSVSDVGIWVMEGDGEVRMALRKGQVINVEGRSRVVKSFLALYPVPGSPSHPRYDESTGHVDVLIAFSDGNSAIASIAPDASLHLSSMSGESNGRTLSRFGVPSSPGDRNLPVALATVRQKGTSPKRAVIDFSSGDPIAVAGEPAPGAADASFRSFLDPVAGAGLGAAHVSAFTARLLGVPREQNEAVYFSAIDGPRSPPSIGTQPALSLLAQKGTPAPGVHGAMFKSFESLAIVTNRGPIFTARLKGDQTARSNDRGCWALASDGSLNLVLRNGDIIAGKSLRNFTILDRVHLSPGQGRAWAANDETPTVILRAKFEDNIDGILSISLP